MITAGNLVNNVPPEQKPILLLNYSKMNESADIRLIALDHELHDIEVEIHNLKVALHEHGVIIQQAQQSSSCTIM